MSRDLVDNDMEELARLREARDSINEVLERYRKGEVDSFYTIGWIESALSRVEDQRS